MTNPITIVCEDPIIHTATTGYYCSSLDNPDWATCPCRMAMEEQVREWQAEQAAAAIATECRIAREQAALQAAWDELQSVPSYMERFMLYCVDCEQPFTREQLVCCDVAYDEQNQEVPLYTCRACNPVVWKFAKKEQ